MYSFSYLGPVCCSMSSSNCCFLTCIQISQEADQVVWYCHLFQNFPQFIVIHTVKGFGIVKKAEVDVFFCNSLDFLMIQQMLAIWSLVPLPFLKPAWTSGSSWFMVDILLKPSVENFEHCFTSVWDECNCVVVWWMWRESLRSSKVCHDPHSQRLWHSQQSRNTCFFLELSCFFDDPTDVGNLISGSSVFSKSSLNIQKFTVHVLLKPGLENFEH